MEDSLQKTENNPKLRYDWYQTESNIVLNIYSKGLKEDDVKIQFNPKLLSMSITLPSLEIYQNEINLNHYIKPEESAFKIYSTKVEVKMKKKEGYHWDSLEDQGKNVEVKQIENKTQPVLNTHPTYPSSSTKKHDWNKIEKELIKDEESEKPEGDAALNQLFQKIYGEGSDEVRKAMNKSFSESGGTVLSTNWNEVKENKCDVKPPDGMEWKKWEQ